MNFDFNDYSCMFTLCRKKNTNKCYLSIPDNSFTTHNNIFFVK